MLAGEEIVIAKGSKIGLLRDRLAGTGPDFFEPMDERELAAWEGRE
jgi:hypothetical protein